MANVINWFEIPATDLERAMRFYGEVLGNKMEVMEIAGQQMAFFTQDTDVVGGALCQGEGYLPSSEGAMIYLNGGDDLSDPLGRVESAGGKVVLPKTQISEEVGYFAIFMDSEGNRVAFHSPQ